MLTFTDHSRSFANYRYVYPVLSRRSQGVSLGINLNINNKCNWQCIYCQVEGLARGKPPKIDLAILETELNTMLELIVHGDFLAQFAPIELRRFNDIAISGNGEPTLAQEFKEVVRIITKLRHKYQLFTQVKTVLITNGSRIHTPTVQQSLAMMAHLNGEVWFKVDAVSQADIALINQVNIHSNNVRRNLFTCAQLCATYIQTCLLQVNNQNPTESSITQYVDFVLSFKNVIAGVLLYSVIRTPGTQIGKRCVSSVTQALLNDVASRLREHGITVHAYL